MTFKIQSVQLADVPQISRVTMSAMHSNLHWRLFWGSLTLQEIIERNEQRLPWMLMTGRDEKRHQIAVDSETGAVVGYARWLLSSGSGIEWPEAMAPSTSGEERERAEQMYKAASQGGRAKELNDEMVAASSECHRVFCEVVGDEPYLGMEILSLSYGGVCCG